jgi:hypothetical protein
MDADQRDAWNARKMVVTVKEHCPECKTLQPAVQKRTNYWPTVDKVCCADCFRKLIADYSGIACC